MGEGQEEYDDLCAAYLGELSLAMTEVGRWWDRMQAEASVRTAPLPLAKRWPTGPAGHPRIIAVFRKYFLLIEALNDRNAHEWENRDRETDPEKLWRGDVEDPAPLHHHPRDLLIGDLADDRPDLHAVMEGMVFVPVGMNHHRDMV